MMSNALVLWHGGVVSCTVASRRKGPECGGPSFVEFAYSPRVSVGFPPGALVFPRNQQKHV